MSKLVIKDLHVEIEGKEILKGISLEVNSGEIHAIMGPNGNGKSTLLKAIMGHPKYNITQGEILLDEKNVMDMSIDERSRAGIFLGMQYPLEVPGVTNSDFLRAAINARLEKPISLFKFIQEMEKNIKNLEMKPDLAHRFLNEGFSGGEKKRNEIMQMRMLKPSIAMLDEIDSGLDVDALKIVASSILQAQNETNLGLLIVSHYERFYQLVQPTYAHVIVNGEIVEEGNFDLVMKIDNEGYDWIYKKHQIDPIKKEKKTPISLGVCASNVRGNK